MNTTCCMCGDPPTPDESPGVGYFEEEGALKYLCLDCWCLEVYGPPFPDDVPLTRPLVPRWL
jgi:hypothetical protein